MNFKAINFKILIPIIILAITSLITLFGLIPRLELMEYLSNGDEFNFVVKQFIGFGIGFSIIIFIQFIDLKQVNVFVNIGYYTLLVMLFILVAGIPGTASLVKNINGARGWFEFPIIGMSIQPVEFMKIFIFFKLALVCAEYKESNWDDTKLFMHFLVYAGLPVLFVLFQPDLGGVMLLAIPSFVMFLVSMKSKKHVMIIVAATLSILVVSVFLLANPDTQAFIVDHTPLYSYQLSRINSWTDPFTQTGGFQLQQSLVLMGSAGPFGHGFGYTGIYLPEPHTDVIYPAFVGMFGWIAGVVLIFIYGYLIVQVFNVVNKTSVLAFKYLCIGYGSLLIVQVFENIGMMIGMLPITGIVLPFMSYGLSALITYSAIFGLLINISFDKP